ncbi:hypothetical protein LSTR_LSTR006958 [Laodelphax striatellus]|uniref:Clarin-3 n=1 Tax=Laodelphax striatellus TaxID=195883 RepID=A0A482WM69_LAOST|nr:hypothetical protein LSTR_LSTR006958 [Laodelphax striatellus]
MMNLYKRGMIFVTFLGSCLSIVLIAAALGTNYWVVAQARRIPNPTESDGHVHFGLFQGVKDLNVAYGWRTYHFSVLDLMQQDMDFMVYSYWMTTVVTTSSSLIFAAASAVFAVINTATTPIGSFTGVPGLYLWNLLTIILQMFAVSFWILQFTKKLQKNVMSLEDQANLWTSDGRAAYGHSFWFVVSAVIVHVINLTFIYFGTSDSREKKSSVPVTEEKGNGAIMLY